MQMQQARGARRAAGVVGGMAAMVAGLALAAFGAAARADEREVLLRFEGAIGVDPVTGLAAPNDVNRVRGINPGGRAWVLRKLRATIGSDGSIRAKGEGLLFASGDGIGSAGAVTAVGASLFCGPAVSAIRFDTPIVPLDAFGNFSIRGTLTGTSVAVLPEACTTPVLLIRNGNGGALGAWFAAGVPVAVTDD